MADRILAAGRMRAPRPGVDQWVRCRACERRFTLAITLPCPVDVYLAAMRGARCACGAGPDELMAYEPGRRPPEFTP
jgi:hypothetical protein